MLRFEKETKHPLLITQLKAEQNFFEVCR